MLNIGCDYTHAGNRTIDIVGVVDNGTTGVPASLTYSNLITGTGGCNGSGEFSDNFYVDGYPGTGNVIGHVNIWAEYANQGIGGGFDVTSAPPTISIDVALHYNDSSHSSHNDEEDFLRSGTDNYTVTLSGSFAWAVISDCSLVCTSNVAGFSGEVAYNEDGTFTVSHDFDEPPSGYFTVTVTNCYTQSAYDTKNVV